MIRFRKTALLTSITLFAAASGLAACQGNGGGGDGDGDGDGDVGDGDGDMGTGGNGTGGGGPGTGGDGAGTGGGGPGTGGNGTGGGASGNPIAGTASYDCTPASGAAGTFQLEEVAGDFDRPLLISHPPDDDRLFVTEQGGRVRLMDGNTNPVVLDIADKVLDPSDGVEGYQEERGLLGLAFHPDFGTNGLFYVHYSARGGQTDFPDGETVIAEYSMVGNTANAGTERVVLNVTQPYTNHNGGTIAFGSDGMLYIALGDGGDGNDPDGNGQNVTTLLGKILRINPLQSGDDDYTVPAGNLSTVEPTAAPEIWDYGLRNPFRMNFDACTGDLYIGDVGQTTKEEINIELAGEGQNNYGWDFVEGSVCGPSGGGGCDDPDFVAPVHDYDRGGGGAVIGGAVYRGAAMPWLRGTYFFTDQQQNQVWTTTFNRGAGTVTEPVNVTGSFAEVGFAAIQNGNDGELYFAQLFGGAVYKLVPGE